MICLHHSEKPGLKNVICLHHSEKLGLKNERHGDCSQAYGRRSLILRLQGLRQEDLRSKASPRYMVRK